MGVYSSSKALTYACIIWGSKVEDKGISTALHRLDRLAMMSISRLHKSTPTKGLNIVFNVMPIKIFIEFTGMKAYCRQFQQLQGEGSVNNKWNHRNYWHTKYTKIFTNLELDVCKENNGANRFEVCEDSFNGEKKFLKHYHLNIYKETGSK